MRETVRAIVLGLGVFFLVVAGLLRFWAPSHAVKTPLNLDITQRASGPSSDSSGPQGNVLAIRKVRVDSAASNSKVVVVQESLCVMKMENNPPDCVSSDDPRLLSVTTDRVASDRRTGEAVNDPKYHENVNGDDTIKHVGLSYKWPFNAKKKTYKFYEPQSMTTPDAVYVGTGKYNGLKCYNYHSVVTAAPADVAPGIPGTIDDVRDVCVEPRTGTILYGNEKQTRHTSTGALALEVNLPFEQSAIDYQAKQAKDGIKKIDALTLWAPLITLVLGLACVGGFVFTSSGVRSRVGR